MMTTGDVFVCIFCLIKNEVNNVRSLVVLKTGVNKFFFRVVSSAAFFLVDYTRHKKHETCNSDAIETVSLMLVSDNENCSLCIRTLTHREQQKKPTRHHLLSARIINVLPIKTTINSYQFMAKF